MEEIFLRCKNVNFLSSFDLTSSFHQIRFSEESRKYTAFICDNRVYEFNVVPFGIKTSSAALIRGLDLAVAGLEDFLITFVDDLQCISEDFDSHLKNIQQLFENLLRNNLRISFKKSKLVQEEIKFLGHILTPEGVKPDPEKIRTIKNFKKPRNVRELQGFLGFVNFYTKFARNYSAHTIPLIKLLKQGKKYEWTEEQEKAFNDIKNIFDEYIILKYADPERPFILTTDASDYAIAAVLSQLNDENEEQIVTFVSRTLKGSEIAYFTTEKEMLAIVWSLTRLDTYLRGAPKIIVRTDHEALTFLKSCKFNNARLRRWSLAIQDFCLEPLHLPGRKHAVADYLSRQMHVYPEIIIASMQIQKPSRELTNNLKDLKKLQENDPYISKLITDIPNDDGIRKRFELKNGLMHKVTLNQNKLMFPESLLDSLVRETHEIHGHVGA